MVAEHDREAAEWALMTCGALDSSRSRLVRVKDTLHLTRFFASEALLADIEADPRLTISGGFAPLAFDDFGRPLPREI
jgi:hypothetical protein